jgi:hypothetical protein
LIERRAEEKISPAENGSTIPSGNDLRRLLHLLNLKSAGEMLLPGVPLQLGTLIA